MLCCKFLGLPSALAKFFCQASVDHFFLEKKPLKKTTLRYTPGPSNEPQVHPEPQPWTLRHTLSRSNESRGTPWTLTTRQDGHQSKMAANPRWPPTLDRWSKMIANPRWPSTAICKAYQKAAALNDSLAGNESDKRKTQKPQYMRMRNWLFPYIRMCMHMRICMRIHLHMHRAFFHLCKAPVCHFSKPRLPQGTTKTELSPKHT